MYSVFPHQKSCLSEVTTSQSLKGLDAKFSHKKGRNSKSVTKKNLNFVAEFSHKKYATKKGMCNMH